MPGVCLWVAGVLLAQLATSQVALEYQHSLYQARVLEHYRVTETALVLEHYESTTAVLEYYGMDPRPETPYPEVRFLSDEIGKHALVWDGGRLELGWLEAKLRLRPCEVAPEPSARWEAPWPSA